MTVLWPNILCQPCRSIDRSIDRERRTSTADRDSLSLHRHVVHASPMRCPHECAKFSNLGTNYVFITPSIFSVAVTCYVAFLLAISHSMLLSCNAGYTRHLSAEEAVIRHPGLTYTASIPKFQRFDGLVCNLLIFQRNWHQPPIDSAFIEKVWAQYFLLYPSTIWNIYTRPAEAFYLRLASWVSTTGLCMLCNSINEFGA